MYLCLSINRTSWPWSYGNWIYNYMCNKCLSPIMLWVRNSMRARCSTLYDRVCQLLATGRLFSPVPPVSSTNKTDSHDITEILLKVSLSTIKRTNNMFIYLNINDKISVLLVVSSWFKLWGMVQFSVFYRLLSVT
jgi:hypothetical protein